jgi:hypothetical protein
MSPTDIQPKFPIAYFPEYRFLTVVIVSAVFLGLAIIAVVLRIISRGYILRSLGLDDILMMICLVCLQLRINSSVLIECEGPIRSNVCIVY